MGNVLAYVLAALALCQVDSGGYPSRDAYRFAFGRDHLRNLKVFGNDSQSQESFCTVVPPARSQTSGCRTPRAVNRIVSMSIEVSKRVREVSEGVNGNAMVGTK